MAETPLIELKHFIQAIRDAGYKGTPAAIAELVDNSFEAEASTVRIEIISLPDSHITNVMVVDNGSGMTASTLKMALQFGGSSRFGSRRGTGRYGMGLPNSSVSQACRVDVYSWMDSKNLFWSYLDVDEIAQGSFLTLPEPQRRERAKLPAKPISIKCGTVIQWSKCDRLSFRQAEPLKKLLHAELGRIFRKQLWQGKVITINGEIVQTVDPLFLKKGNNIAGASTYGNLLEYKIKLPGNHDGKATSMVKVAFSELPIEQWRSFSNRNKRAYGISMNPGISIVRAGREIDRGWYFMGAKRKENYDDWWRCEVEFLPDIDELFGVTHTKQGIIPSPELVAILTPDIEAIAHKLNNRVRMKFVKLQSAKLIPSEHRANECDMLFEPPTMSKKKVGTAVKEETYSRKNGGIDFKLSLERSDDSGFYQSELKKNRLELVLNDNHPFAQRFYGPVSKSKSCDSHIVKKYIELLLFAAARAEYQFSNGNSTKIRKFKNTWSDILAAYLS